MFDKLMGKIKQRVIRDKLNTSIDEIAGMYGIMGKHAPQLIAGTNKAVINGVLDSDKVDKIILGAELLIEGLKAVDWKSMNTEIKAIQNSTGISDEMEAYMENECGTFLDLIGNGKKDREDLDEVSEAIDKAS